MMYNVLLIGSGGREHALAWKLSQSPLLKHLFIAPGNPGTAALGTNLNVSAVDFEGIKAAVLEHAIDLVVAGPEDPLVNGIVDFFAADRQLAGIPVTGPCARGAQLEGSKDFAKSFMQRHAIPTARYQTVTMDTLAAGEAFIDTLSPPCVLKADGLAAGKGVLIVESKNEAKAQLRTMLRGMFGAASNKVVVEEFLRGIELSVFVLTDGHSYKLLPEAKDYKRIGEGDTGLNTGGMGAVSPVPFATPDFLGKVAEQVVAPTLAGLQEEGIIYKGFLFIGLMNVNGEPYVIEYNVRLGDPEAEAILPRLEADLLDLFQGVANGTLAEKTMGISPHTAVTVVCVSDGYPQVYKKGCVISGLDAADGTVFHAGTTAGNAVTVTAGGRVLAVTSLAENMTTARAKTYDTIRHIHFDGMYYRHDIGNDLLAINTDTLHAH